MRTQPGQVVAVQPQLLIRSLAGVVTTNTVAASQNSRRNLCKSGGRGEVSYFVPWYLFTVHVYPYSVPCPPDIDTGEQ
jgi:hypothetical protein